MKVTGPRGPGATRPANKVAGARPAAPAEPAAAIDAVSIAGIPENELTPRVRSALVSLMQEVADLRRELIEARRKMSELESLASTDPLLGVLNRRAFVGELNRALAMAQRYQQASSLVFVDLDNLKKINDAHGHAAGDKALAHASSIIAANIRQTDVFGRLGGDEFAIILTNTPKPLAAQKAQSLAALIKATPEPNGLTVSVTCGVVEISADLTAESALMAADRVMYEEKRRR
jgi:diguanylate cyclase (GGDEF)-like protein